jgi:fibronectin type 3 domain-containing protein
MKIATLCLVLLITGCGKVGAPLPPFIRVPEPVTDLKVRQDGNDLILTWTNPATYIDGSEVTDLGQIQIRTNDVILMKVDATAAGQIQTLVMPVGAVPGVSRSFAVTAETTRGKLSQVSNTVSISPVAVPGKVVGLHAVVDQRRITLVWEKPQDHPELADAYRVSRIEPPETQIVPETHYEDLRYRAGQMYIYQVTAMRGMVPGAGPESVSVVIEDKTPPQIPSGLDIVVSETGAFITWSANAETDLAGYRVLRNGTSVSDRPIATNSFFDPDYRAGVVYAVSAVDEFGNESAQSSPLR